MQMDPRRNLDSSPKAAERWSRPAAFLTIGLLSCAAWGVLIGLVRVFTRW